MRDFNYRHLLRKLRQSTLAWAVLDADGTIDPRTVHDIRGKTEGIALIRPGAKLVRVRVIVEGDGS